MERGAGPHAITRSHPPTVLRHANLDVEAAILRIAVQAELFTARKAEIGFGGALAAALTGMRTKEAGTLRQGQPGLLHVEECGGVGVAQIGEALLTAHLIRKGTQQQAPRAAVPAAVKRIGGLATQAKEQIATPDTAAQQNLNRVDTTGVVLGDTDNLLVLRVFKIKQTLSRGRCGRERPPRLPRFVLSFRTSISSPTQTRQITGNNQAPAAAAPKEFIKKHTEVGT